MSGNTFDPSSMAWHPRDSEPDNSRPVLAEYHQWNDIRGNVDYQVVWWFNGAWRTYPKTDGTAYVNRWAELTMGE